MRTFSTSSRARRARRTRLSADVRPAPRDSSVDSSAAQLPPGSWSILTREPIARRAPRAALRPSGPRRRRRAPSPGSRPSQLGAATSQRKRAVCKSCHPPGAPVLSRGRSPSRARLRRVLRMAQAPLLTLIFHGSFGAYRKDGKDRIWPLTPLLYPYVYRRSAPGDPKFIR